MCFTSAQWHSPCAAPAKINLFLHVLNRRPNGYHTIQTCFRLIDLCDSLTFSPRSDDQICLLNPPHGIKEEEELSIRAARLLKETAALTRESVHLCGVNITIDKRIPMGGGLGGGSSDAATALLALNTLWNLGYSSTQLQKIGATLGADIPFFIFGRDAFANGIGEELTAVNLPNAHYVLLFPPVSVPTAQIFKSPDLKRDCLPINLEALQASSTQLSDIHTNVLTPVAVKFYPIIQTYLNWLSQFGRAKMSGSGSCVYTEFKTREDAMKVFNQRPKNFKGVVVSSLSRHPLAVDAV